MKLRSSQSSNMIVLVEHEAFAGAFSQLYSYGMKLIDESSDYFSGEGRQAARLLGHEAHALYADEVKRLSSRLMQVASWLLLARAVREQDMSVEAFSREKKKVVLDAGPLMQNHPHWHELPERFRNLYEKTMHFMERVHHIDRETSCLAETDENGNSVSGQLLRLKNAFDRCQKS